MRITPLLSLPMCLLVLACQPTAENDPTATQPAPAVGTTEPQYKSVLETHQADVRGTNPKMGKLLSDDHIGLLKASLAKHDEIPIRRYTCTFTKQETLRGSLRKQQVMKVKFQLEPFSVAVKWTQNPPPGDALIFIAGKWKDKEGRDQMLVRPQAAFRWLVGQSVLRRPDGPDAMKNSAKPITLFGFANATKSLLEIYELAAANGDLKQDWAGMTEVGGRTCAVIRRILPKKDEYPAWITETCIDLDTLQPLRIVGYDWNGKLWADYMYTDVTLNPDFAADAFDPKANGIEPPK